MQKKAHIPAEEPLEQRPELERLFEQHAEFVRALARNLLGNAGDPDDLTQEVFFLAWRKLDDYRGAGMRRWLCEITVRLAAGMRRKAWWRRTLGLEAAGELVAPESPERDQLVRDAARILQAALSTMSEKKRTVFVLAELHDFTAPEIATTVGCPIETVYSRLSHARRELVRYFERTGLKAPLR